ncbi:Yae1 family protein [Candidatus Stoquefichus sp. SB1]|uniref:Yae1 family protein n=1 Tax=Candidatus Stoquefichus sp. SB1 TaxID=1658109 RepID=UPI00067EC13A|nr:Yae1 family protein [Candidatus Stoquefichus sp. SB1]
MSRYDDYFRNIELERERMIIKTKTNIARKEGLKEGREEGLKEGRDKGKKEECYYNVPLNVDTIRRRHPIRWTNKKGTDSLIVDTEKRVF